MDIFGAAGALAVAIPFIVGLLKKLKWMNSKFAALAAFALGALGGVIAFYVKMTPEGMTLLQALMAGIAIGGTSTGLYDLTKKLSGN